MKRRKILTEATGKIDTSLRDWLLLNFGDYEFLENKSLEGLKETFHKYGDSVIVTLENTYVCVFHIHTQYFRLDTSKKQIAWVPQQSVDDILAQLNIEALNWVWKTLGPTFEAEGDVEQQTANVQTMLNKYKDLLEPFTSALH